MTKEHIYSTSAAETAGMLAAFMQTHAVPTYFDSVELSGTTITCKIGDLAFLTLDCDPARLTITNSYGVYLTASSEAISSLATAWRYAYACDGGICLSNYETGKITVTICKNSDDKTTVIYNFGQSNSDIYAISPESVASTPTSFTKRTYSDPKTVLTPFLVSTADGAYTPTVSMLTYTQYTNDNATLDIDGIDYLSNGSWAVKA